MKKILIPLFSVAALASFQTATAADAEALFGSKGCVACHSIDRKLVGPSYQEVAAKRTADDVQLIADHIKNGSQGDYGPIPMPPNPVSEEEAKVLAEWVITQ